MPYRFLCNDVQRDGAKPSPDLAYGLFCYVPFHNIWYGIWEKSTYLLLEETTPLQKLKGAAWNEFIELIHNPSA